MIEEQDYIQRLEDEIARLEKENKHLKSELECYENGLYFSSEVDKLQEKINKAIDYIQENYDKDLYDDTLTAFEDNLVKILTGDDKE